MRILRSAIASFAPIATLVATLFHEHSANAQIAQISLKEAIARAMQHSPTAAIAEVEVKRAEALLASARSASLPTLNANGVYTHLDNDRELQGRVILAQNQLGANLTLAVPIIVPKAWAVWGQAKDVVDVARFSKADVNKQVAIATGRAYLAVLVQRRLLQSTEHARDNAKAHFEFARSRQQGGVGNKLDEARAEQELASNEARAQNTRTGLFRAQEALGVLVGNETPLDVSEDPDFASGPSMGDALNDTATKRTDILSLKRRAEAADRAASDNYTDYLPYLTGVGQAIYQNPPTLSQPLTGWQVQLLLTLPLYDGGNRSGQGAQRNAVAAQAKTSLEAALRQARSDVRNAFQTMQNADRALAESRRAEALAQKALELATTAYRAGATTNLDVVDAERKLRDAETDTALAEDGARQARLDLLAATGRFP